MPCLYSPNFNSSLRVILPKKNILIDDHRQAVICDFGLSRASGQKPRILAEILANSHLFRYIAPELSVAYAQETPLLVSFYSEHKSDVYSLGMTIWALGRLQIPFSNIRNNKTAAQAALSTERPPMRHAMHPLGWLDTARSRRLGQMVEGMWAPEPAARPSLVEVKSEESMEVTDDMTLDFMLDFLKGRLRTP